MIKFRHHLQLEETDPPVKNWDWQREALKKQIMSPMNLQIKHKHKKKKEEWSSGEVLNTEEHHQSQATSKREQIPEKVLHNNKALQLEKEH